MKKTQTEKVITRSGKTRYIYPDNRFNLAFFPTNLTVEECATFLGVSTSTIRRYRNGSVKPPRAVIQALRMLNGYAPNFQSPTKRPKDFTNWRFVNGKLWTDEGMGYTAGEIRAIWYMEQELKFRTKEMDKMKELINDLRDENARLKAELNRLIPDNVTPFPGTA